MVNFYEVTFVDANGAIVSSRIFEHVRGARAWARWLKSQKYTADVTIWRGGIGGEKVA